MIGKVTAEYAVPFAGWCSGRLRSGSFGRPMTARRVDHARFVLTHVPGLTSARGVRKYPAYGIRRPPRRKIGPD
ncbi:hypothetical protein BAUCODRAFT_405811 [Baudoinia panamericana UAMH 10762]|uniref:Uncharacterized protein n=1 Tax=Baudoinia panamericana (strain UAMH 10762) TaxID=717646 RepID=M2NFS4_BAUPA|nr:uncharacterized protein BAUCODRAFT_405811 [Baudoinia panamericana UAMH 10762]EMC97850.1 hypothetical protein BAUCODRAFT_405811 [Baudoinia panamericana UAMH 10762]